MVRTHQPRDCQVANLSAAIMKLPDRELEIRRLAACNESFRTLCEDLGDAMHALEHRFVSATVIVPERISEYQSLIEALVAEMQATLDSESRRNPSPDPA
jgi:hypothetical protein